MGNTQRQHDVSDMESVIQTIRQSREDDKKKRTDSATTETVVNGCSVKIRFAAQSDSSTISVIRSNPNDPRMGTVPN